ncbi:MAG: non-hydrolyzing UDP-N-acetylglucosamine 2-epimerase [Vicinamibacterales bacterium]
MRVLTVVGARPQFIKAAPIRRALEAAGHTEILVHTGQHYDEYMSAAHFRDLGLADPDINLQIGSGTHGEQTARMLAALEAVMTERVSDWVVVYGDTNSTLAGALAAVKLRIPLAHVEAGQRSYRRSMPEEINRVLADHASDLLLCATPGAVANLAAEGIRTNVHLVGDVMIDTLAWMLRSEQTRSDIRTRLGLETGAYLVATVHRAENTDDAKRLRAIVAAFDQLDETIVFPVHPRTRKVLAAADWVPAPHVRVIDPVSYSDMIELERGARMILTDSGGMQKEAYFLGVPCVMLRDETEWVEIVEAGWGALSGADCGRILSLVHSFHPPTTRPPLHGDGQAAARCVAHLERVRVSR